MKTNQTLSLSLLSLILALAPAPRPATAAVFTVGPGGAYPSLLSAFTAALAGTGPQEIRVHTGIYPESLQIVVATQQIVVTGGWANGFAQRGTDPAATVIDGRALVRPLALEVYNGAVTLDGLTFANGRALGQGGGVLFLLHGGAVTMRGCIVRDSRVEESLNAARGGGIEAEIGGGGQLVLASTSLVRNVLHASTVSPAGAGLQVRVGQDAPAVVTLSGLTVRGNVIDAGAKSGAYGAGADIEIGGGTVSLVDSQISDNRYLRGTGYAGLSAYATGASARMELRRLRLVANAGPGAGVQASVQCDTGATITLSDSLIAKGTLGGLFALNKFGAIPSGTVHLTNLTVADNAGGGIDATADGKRVSLSNTILANPKNNLTLRTGPLVVAGNLVGGDPKFVHRSTGDYRLTAGSPAVNRGVLAPAGGLGALDLARQARVHGGKVDAGAYESF